MELGVVDPFVFNGVLLFNLKCCFKVMIQAKVKFTKNANKNKQKRIQIYL